MKVKIGAKFGKLTILELSHRRIVECPSGPVSVVYWKCQCECGNIKSISSSNILRRKIPSCGCSCNGKNPDGKSPYKDRKNSPIPFWYISSLKKGAKKRELEYNVSEDYLWEVFLSQNKQCVLSGRDLVLIKSNKKQQLQTASLDRIDSSKGYVEGNVQWVHKNINLMKVDFTDKEFIEMCEDVARFTANKRLHT